MIAGIESKSSGRRESKNEEGNQGARDIEGGCVEDWYVVMSASEALERKEPNSPN